MTEPEEVSLDHFLGGGTRRGRTHLLRIALLAAAVVALVLLVVRFLGGTDSPFYTALVEQGSITPLLSERGTVHGSGEVALAAALDGTVTAEGVPAGGKVEKGQILATIDAEPLRSTLAADRALVAAAEADLEAARGARDEATSKLARFEDVWRRSGHRVPAINELEAARTAAERAAREVAAAEARVSAARNSLKADSETLAAAVVRAPFAGYVVERNIRTGQRVRVGMKLFTLAASDETLEIEIPLARAGSAGLDAGTVAQVRIDAMPDDVQQATLARVLADSADAPGSRRAVFTLEKPTEAIRPGMAATVEVALPERKNVLLVPDAALTFEPGSTGGAHVDGNSTGRNQPRIYLVSGDGEPRRVYVSAGAGDGKRTEVFANDLKPGAEVIVGWRNPPEKH
ncbi:HlyD family secretion protein [Novosphingobium sp. PhB165]|uniref:efflux RND transporter periplasmic adaptor subunit n=1 Tax=Novosphingobium sp. PhB165 TaxID=2485105 RepID=UPI00104611C9|nr:HlyD family efflux transporter periplasmic adaptor subunit [Novosphingobium sp. PhB165]TCM19716.1 HlyD family secretion protein [Novosphingobium sp. PhB165]